MAKLLLEGKRFHLHPRWILHADFSKTHLEQQDILKLFAISTLKTCFYRLVSLLGYFVLRHILKTLVYCHSLSCLRFFRYVLSLHEGIFWFSTLLIYIHYYLFFLSVCVHLYSTTLVYSRPAWFFLPVHSFSSYLGSCVALGHTICDCIVFPITFPILRPREQLDGVRSKAHPVTLQQRPACLEYKQPSSTNIGSTSPNLPSVPPQPLCVPQSGLSWRQGPLHSTGLAGSSFAWSLLESIWTFSSHTAHMAGNILVRLEAG